MKLILLHGLGQSAQSWQQVQEKLTISDVRALSLFDDFAEEETVDLQALDRKLGSVLGRIREPFVLAGLSLGAILALKQVLSGNPFLRGFIVAGAQFEAPNPFVMLIQNAVFGLIPARLFRKTGIPLSKKQTLRLMHSLKTLDLREGLGAVTLPGLILCGAKDKANLKAARQLQAVMPHTSLTIVPNGGHELNVTSPDAFAEAINRFLQRL